jgi:hypothetical protein
MFWGMCLVKMIPFTPREVLEHLVGIADGKGSHFMHLLPNALHLALRVRYLHCSSCHLELRQVGFTAA